MSGDASHPLSSIWARNSLKQAREFDRRRHLDLASVLYGSSISNGGARRLALFKPIYIRI